MGMIWGLGNNEKPRELQLLSSLKYFWSTGTWFRTNITVEKKKVIWIGWYIHKKNKFLRNKLKLEKNEQK